MNERNSQKNMRINRHFIKSHALLFSPVTFVSSEDWDADYVLQWGRTLGLDRYKGQQDIEVLVDFCTGDFNHSVLQSLVKRVVRGERFRLGDIIRIQDNICGQSYTVEFRKSCDWYGRCLRAVIVGIEREYQSMNTEKAADYRASINRLNNRKICG